MRHSSRESKHFQETCKGEGIKQRKKQCHYFFATGAFSVPPAPESGEAGEAAAGAAPAAAVGAGEAGALEFEPGACL